MKVTNEMKNYIERKLKERQAFKLSETKASKDMDAATAEEKELCRKVEEIRKKACDEVEKLIGKAKYCVLDDGRWYPIVQLHDEYIVPKKHIQDSFAKANEEANARRCASLEDIVVAMSLGGTKDDLDRLISEADI